MFKAFVHVVVKSKFDGLLAPYIELWLCAKGIAFLESKLYSYKLHKQVYQLYD